MKYGIFKCGYVIFKDYIMTFGGSLARQVYTDAIFVLDLRRDQGWIELQHIKCPLKSNYRAVLDGENNVHLMSTSNEFDRIEHYSIPIKHILRDGKMLVIGYMRIYIFDEKITNEAQYDISLNSIIIDYVGIVA